MPLHFWEHIRIQQMMPSLESMLDIAGLCLASQNLFCPATFSYVRSTGYKMMLRVHNFSPICHKTLMNHVSPISCLNLYYTNTLTFSLIDVNIRRRSNSTIGILLWNRHLLFIFTLLIFSVDKLITPVINHNHINIFSNFGWLTISGLKLFNFENIVDQMCN